MNYCEWLYTVNSLLASLHDQNSIQLEQSDSTHAGHDVSIAAIAIAFVTFCICSVYHYRQRMLNSSMDIVPFKKNKH